MKLFLLQLKQNGQYVKGSTSYPVKQYTTDKSKARVYRTKTSALMSANNGFSLKKLNGQQSYNIIEIELN